MQLLPFRLHLPHPPSPVCRRLSVTEILLKHCVCRRVVSATRRHLSLLSGRDWCRALLRQASSLLAIIKTFGPCCSSGVPASSSSLVDGVKLPLPSVFPRCLLQHSFILWAAPSRSVGLQYPKAKSASHTVSPVTSQHGLTLLVEDQPEKEE